MKTQTETLREIIGIAGLDLPAYHVTLSDGTSYVTSMANGVTLADAKAYFMGQVQVEECFESGREIRRIVVKVEASK